MLPFRVDIQVGESPSSQVLFAAKRAIASGEPARRRPGRQEWEDVNLLETTYSRIAGLLHTPAVMISSREILLPVPPEDAGSAWIDDLSLAVLEVEPVGRFETTVAAEGFRLMDSSLDRARLTRAE